MVINTIELSLDCLLKKFKKNKKYNQKLIKIILKSTTKPIQGSSYILALIKNILILIKN